MIINRSLKEHIGKHRQRELISGHKRAVRNPFAYQSKTNCDDGKDFPSKQTYVIYPDDTKTNHFKHVADLRIKINDIYIGKLDTRLSNLYDAIITSKYMLDLNDNWDEQGSIGYKVDTWTKAVRLLINYSSWVLTSLKNVIIIPQIYHAPNGSIDIYWETPTYNMLLNIPENGVATYYGDNYDRTKSEGELDVTDLSFHHFPVLI